jgi:hypothetical protein
LNAARESLNDFLQTASEATFVHKSREEIASIDDTLTSSKRVLSLPRPVLGEVTSKIVFSSCDLLSRTVITTDAFSGSEVKNKENSQSGDIVDPQLCSPVLGDDRSLSIGENNKRSKNIRSRSKKREVRGHHDEHAGRRERLDDKKRRDKHETRRGEDAARNPRREERRRGEEESFSDDYNTGSDDTSYDDSRSHRKRWVTIVKRPTH